MKAPLKFFIIKKENVWNVEKSKKKKLEHERSLCRNNNCYHCFINLCLALFKMKREIKFRAWDKEKKQIFYPSSISWKGEIMWCGDVHGNNRYETAIEDCELMQFTGLKDKNGKEIYEGDIIHYFETIPSENEKQLEIQNAEFVQLEFNGVIEWDEEGCSFDIVNENNIRGFGARGTWEMEIIGNIYENPELLKSS